MKRDTRYYQQHGLLRIFLSYFGPHRRLFLLDMLCALFIGAVDLIFPLISRRAINTMLPAHAYHTFFVVMGIMAAAYLVRAFLRPHVRHPRGGGYPPRPVPPYAEPRL